MSSPASSRPTSGPGDAVSSRPTRGLGDAGGPPAAAPEGDARGRAVAKLEAAMATGDLTAIERCTEKLLAPGVTWLGSAGGACHSRDEVLAVLRTQLDEGLAFRLVELLPYGDQMLLSVELRPQEGQRRPVLPWRVVLTFDDAGRIVHMQDYADLAIARRDMELRAGVVPARTDGAGAVTGLVPFVHVADVAASATFYGLLGFSVLQTHRAGGILDWACLGAGDARLMLASAGAPVVPEEQAVLFYLYSPDLAALREHLVSRGVLAGEIADGTPGPRREMRVTDPDGYALMVAEIGS